MRRMLMSRCSLEKPSSRGKMLADQVAVEHGDRAAADFQELRHEDVGDGRFAGAGKPGEENRDALLVREAESCGAVPARLRDR